MASELEKQGKLIDAYWVPNEEVEEYVRQREELATRATRFFNTYCYEVSRDWAGSQDGEAIVGYNAENEIMSLIHLDPMGMHMMEECETEKEFEEMLLFHNEISPARYKELVEQKKSWKKEH